MSEIEEFWAVFTERPGVDGVRVQEPPRVDELDLGEVPQLFAGTKAELDPAGIMTPGSCCGQLEP